MSYHHVYYEIKDWFWHWSGKYSNIDSRGDSGGCTGMHWTAFLILLMLGIIVFLIVDLAWWAKVREGDQFRREFFVQLSGRSRLSEAEALAGGGVSQEMMINASVLVKAAQKIVRLKITSPAGFEEFQLLDKDSQRFIRNHFNDIKLVISEVSAKRQNSQAVSDVLEMASRRTSTMKIWLMVGVIYWVFSSFILVLVFLGKCVCERNDPLSLPWRNLGTYPLIMSVLPGFVLLYLAPVCRAIARRQKRAGAKQPKSKPVSPDDIQLKDFLSAAKDLADLRLKLKGGRQHNG